MNELNDDGRTRGIDGPVEWARPETEARKILESGPELANRVETAQDINRIPDCRMPGRLAPDRGCTNYLDTTNVMVLTTFVFTYFADLILPRSA